MTWSDRFYMALLLGCLMLYVGDCASFTVGRDLVRAIDRNTKAIRDQTKRCR